MPGTRSSRGSTAKNKSPSSSSGAKRRLDFDGTLLTTTTTTAENNNSIIDRTVIDNDSISISDGKGGVTSSSNIPAVTAVHHQIEGTPQKNRKTTKKQRVDAYFSPKAAAAASTATKSAAAAAVVTPEKAAETATTTSSITFSPIQRKGFATKEEKETKKKETIIAYVPTYIHKNLQYQRQGQASLSSSSSAQQRTFDLIQEHYVIPHDIETNKAVYGPLSGTCYEERVIQAYERGLLLQQQQQQQQQQQLAEKKDDDDDDEEEEETGVVVVEICSHCAVVGHTKDDCPELV